MAQATTYLATAPKSNASYLAIDEALGDIRAHRAERIPEHLINRPVEAVGKSKAAYRYPHDYPYGWVEQTYSPNDTPYYRPVSRGYEETIAKRMAFFDSLKKRCPPATSG